MTLIFETKLVSCLDAMGGDILQVYFDTLLTNDEEDNRCTPYVLISRMFEFPQSAAIEWHDGNDYDGGAEIIFITLSRECISIKIDQGLDFNVTFRLPNSKFVKLKSFLGNMIDADRILLAD